jgi:cell division septum initiation protein DivIVA
MPLQSDKLRLLRRIPEICFEEEMQGYSKDQVDRVLANLAPLADEIERLQARLAEAENRAVAAETRLVEARSPSSDPLAAAGMPPAPQPDFDETLRNTLVSAQRQADLTIRESREEAERLRTEAEFQSNALLADARDQASEMTTEAVANRERMLAEAAAERARLLEEARAESRSRVESVEAELADAYEGERTSLIGQIEDLQATHRLLQDDVARFEQHLADRTAVVRAALADITGALDDPARLRLNETPAPAPIDEFRSADYPPIGVEVESLNELETEAAASAAMVPPAPEPVDPSELADVELVSGQADGDAEPAVFDGADFETDLPIDDEPFDEGIDIDLVAAEEVDPAITETRTILAEGDDGEADPFLDELRRVTTEDPNPDDPIEEFINHKHERGGSGWFGRRR